ncbi:MAG: M15 family metallopeptidase [Dehalococcoidia bacterium]
MAINLNDPRNATARGFGRMWTPATNNDPRTDMVSLSVVIAGPDPVFVGGMHPALHDLAQLLIEETARRGYVFDVSPQQDWGFAWRAIRDSNPPVASNHSSGCALDINSVFNYLGRTDGGDVPAWMVKLWNSYGWRWGGDYTGREDPMHWEFMGTIADAKRMTAKARKELEDVALTTEQKAALQFVIGERLFLAGKPEPKAKGPRRQGWRHAQEQKALADAIASAAETKP